MDTVLGLWSLVVKRHMKEVKEVKELMERGKALPASPERRLSSDVSRLHLGCISAVSRLYLGCISAESMQEDTSTATSCQLFDTTEAPWICLVCGE